MGRRACRAGCEKARIAPAHIRGMNTINRVPAGVPAGGQFSEVHRAEAHSTALAEPSEAASTGSRVSNYDFLSRTSQRFTALEARRIAFHAEQLKPGATSADFTYYGEDEMALSAIDGEKNPEWEDSEHCDEMMLAASELERECVGLDDSHGEYHHNSDSGDLSVNLACVRSQPVPPALQHVSPFDPVGREVAAAHPSATAWAPVWDEAGQSYSSDVEVLVPGQSVQRLSLGDNPEARHQIDWMSDRACSAGEGAETTASEH